MSPGSQDEYVRYRLSQARETLREAEVLMAEDMLRGAVNRSYYAMFYALQALLATRSLSASKHSGAIALFDREFVKTGLFSRDDSRALHIAFDQRQDHDYGEILETDHDTAAEIFRDAERFVDAIDAYIARE